MTEQIPTTCAENFGQGVNVRRRRRRRQGTLHGLPILKLVNVIRPLLDFAR